MITLRQSTPRLTFAARPVADGVRVGWFVTIPDKAFWLIVAAVLIGRQVGRDAVQTWQGVNEVCGDVYTAWYVVGWIVLAAVTPLERGR